MEDLTILNFFFAVLFQSEKNFNSAQFSSVQLLNCVHEKELEKAKRCSFFKNF